MIGLRLAVPAVLAAAAVAGWFANFATPAPVEERLPPARSQLTNHPDTKASTSIDQLSNAEVKAAEAYLEAAKAILRRAPDARASIGADEPPIPGPIPLPKRRPITRP